MSRSMAYVLSIISMVLIGTIIAGKYLGFNVPILGDIINPKKFEVAMLCYFMLLIPALWRR